MRATVLRSLWPCLVLLAGCQCGPFGVEDTRFACAADADCLEGFECREVGGGKECVRQGSPTDAGSGDAGSGDAGEVDAGEVDAGEVDGGEVDGGEVDAGEPDAGEVDGGGVDAGEPDAGDDAGVPADPPTRLRFSTAPQTVVSGGCSQIIALETVGADGGVRPVAGPTDVALDSTPAGVSFFTASNCGGAPTTTVTVGASQASTSFYASVPGANTWTLTANAAGLLEATQPLTGILPPNALVFTSTPPSPLRAGLCLQGTLEARRGSTAAPVASTTTVGLTVTPTGAVRFFSDSACASSITTTSIPAGFSTAAFFYKPLTGVTATMTANAPFGSASQVLNIVPIVRRGTCSYGTRQPLADGGFTTDLTLNCPLSPPVVSTSSSVVIWQTIGPVSGGEGGTPQTRCRLSSTSNLSCVRRQDGEPADVHYQVAEIPSGLSNQRFTSTSCPATLTLATPVAPASSFVLKGAANSTNSFDDEDVVVAFLNSSTTVALSPASCNGHDVQVVEWPGITVVRGVVNGGMPAGVNTLTVSGLPNASMNRAVILQPGTAFNGNRPVCSTLVRAAMPSNNSIVLTRTAGDAGCTGPAMDNILYERIDFAGKGNAREYTVALDPGDTTKVVSVSAVDTTRTIVFASSQASGGQGMGESDHDGPTAFTEGAFHLALTGSSSVTVTRALATSRAVVTFYVVELSP